jgi:hypothetical protein
VKPDVGLVDVMLLVDKSIIGVFDVVPLLFVVPFPPPLFTFGPDASDPVGVVDVGDGELDDAL